MKRFSRWLKDLGAYAAVKPYDAFPAFFLSGYGLVILTLLLPDSFATWPG